MLDREGKGHQVIDLYPVINLCLLICSYPQIICGLRGAEEVDEAEDYEAPGSNPGQEL
jgi:hypothetical protein